MNGKGKRESQKCCTMTSLVYRWKLLHNLGEGHLHNSKQRCNIFTAQLCEHTNSAWKPLFTPQKLTAALYNKNLKIRKRWEKIWRVGKDNIAQRPYTNRLAKILVFRWHFPIKLGPWRIMQNRSCIRNPRFPSILRTGALDDMKYFRLPRNILSSFPLAWAVPGTSPCTQSLNTGLVWCDHRVKDDRMENSIKGR